MPTLQVRKSSDVPRPSKATRVVRELQELYEGFVRGIGTNVGELELASGETLRSVRTRLTRAATRLGQKIQVWDVDNRVYFSSTTPNRRVRPRKQ